MNRRSSDYEINLLFDNNSKSISSYTLFGSSKKFNLETITKKLIISSNKIELDYILEGNKFSYILEVEDL